ncbi:META domain-containing protein [Stagnihabitans tardus]|uniref:META domain-containing protein n=1 Tax=Stagnihabitans tardus TaxID=2699202 RepID=UPI001D11619F
MYRRDKGLSMMACPDALMEQERRVLEILAGTVSYEITEDGALILNGTDGRKIMARQ